MELLIASAIMFVVMVVIYSGFQGGIFSSRRITASLERHQAAGYALGRINADLRNAFPYSKDETKFRGDSDHIGFLTLTDEEGVDGLDEEYDHVSYELEGDRLMRVALRSKDSLDENAEPRRDELLDGVAGLAFSYGLSAEGAADVDWQETWSDGRRLPLKIRVTLVLKDADGREVFTREIVQPVAVYE